MLVNVQGTVRHGKQGIYKKEIKVKILANIFKQLVCPFVTHKKVFTNLHCWAYGSKVKSLIFQNLSIFTIFFISLSSIRPTCTLSKLVVHYWGQGPIITKIGYNYNTCYHIFRWFPSWLEGFCHYIQWVQH
jgi:hypothetical protein